MKKLTIRLPLVAAVLVLGAVVVAQPANAAAPTGTASGWGADSYGEVGNGVTATKVTKPVAVTALPKGVVSVAAGARHSFAILGDGSVKAWGRNAAGELGTGNTTEQHAPVSIPAFGPGSGVVAIAGNGQQLTTTQTSADGHSMALKSDGSVWGWGHGDSGQVGDGVALPVAVGTHHNVLAPVAVSGLGASANNPVTAIAAGGAHSLAVKHDGSVWSWGNNTSGQLGDGGALPGTDRSTPAQVSGLGASAANPVVAICGGDAFSAALKQDGSVWTWGNNTSGELGDNTVNDRSTPAAVSGVSGVSKISCGAAFIVVLESNGAVMAWGNNASGQIGNNTAPTDQHVPKAVTGLGAGSGIVDLATGHSHVLARKSDNTVTVWGRNASGQLGDGTTTQENTPKALTLTGVTSIAAGGAHSFAVRSPSLTFTPKKGTAGLTVSASGARFGSGESVTVSYATGLVSPTSMTICTGLAASDGTFSCSGPIPTTNTGAPGAHAITATGGSSGLTAAAGTFTLLPTVTISPKSGPSGTSVSLTGAHYIPGEIVKFAWLTNLSTPARITLCSATADSNGTATCPGKVPTTNVGPTGSHTISAAGATSKVAGTTTFTLS
jgi:alpha-tubulin suppressor-like RCC1 family protein